MTLSFLDEQKVQFVIAVVQKTQHLSILQIDVPAIRDQVARGQSTGAILAWLNRPVKES